MATKTHVTVHKSDSQIDFSDAPEWTPEMMARARLVLPGERVKSQLTIRLDPDIIAHFKLGGRGYQTRINAVLRAFVDDAEERERADEARKAS